MSSNRVEPLKDHDSAQFLFMWVVANTAGLLAGRWLGGEVINLLWPAPPVPPDALINVAFTNPIPRVIIVGLATGTLIGFLELLVFRLFGFRVNWLWAASNTFACAVFLPVGEAISSSRQLPVADSVAVVGGVVLGTAQWRILRQIVNRAGWWILATGITGTLLFRSVTPNPSYEPVMLIWGIIVGGITGVVLVLLLKHPVQPPRYRSASG